MTSFKRFSPEELAGLRVWQLPAVGAEDAEPEAEAEPEIAAEAEVWDEPELPAMPTAEEIEAMQREAYEEGKAEGYKDGLEQGLAEGRERGYREGREQGLQEGTEAGKTEALAAMQPNAERLAEILDLLEAPLAELDEQLEEQLVSLTVAIARQLIRRELRTEPGEIVAAVREAIAALPAASRKISLHLHPEDAELIRNALALEERGVRWRIVEDPLLSRGGCRVSTETSHVDATVEKRLATVLARLWGGGREDDQR